MLVMNYPRALEITSKGRIVYSRHRKYLWAAIALGLFFVLLIYRASLRTHFAFFGDQAIFDDNTPFRRTHVAIASAFGVHFDVHLPVGTTIHDIMGEDANVQAFAHLPFRFGFQEIVDSLHLYDKPIQSPDRFLDIVTAGTPYPDEPGQSFDLIILGTCEIESVLTSLT